MMSRMRFTPAGKCTMLAGVVIALFVASAVLRGADLGKPAANRQKAQQNHTVELFQAVEAGEIDVKLIPSNDKEANVIITNKTKRPLTVRLPEAFAGVPVLAQQIGQFGGGAVGAGNNDNDNNNNNQNQSLGGGFGGGGLGGGLGGLGGGGFGGAFNIAPEKVGKLKVACVCLEHGKKDPNPRVPYTMKPIDEFTKDVKVQVVLKLLASGKINQRIAQAAAWHFANGITWQQLAAKKIDRLGRPDEPYFRPAELRSAFQVAALSERVAKQQQSSSEAASSTSSYSQR